MNFYEPSAIKSDLNFPAGEYNTSVDGLLTRTIDLYISLSSYRRDQVTLGQLLNLIKSPPTN